VIEFNCRLGDPETQPILSRLKSSLTDLCIATLDGSLQNQTAEWDTRAALGVVLAAGGYPARYDKGWPIRGLDVADSVDQKVFHAGTTTSGDQVVTSGGRVLCVVGLGESVAAAAASAYEAVDKIHWQDVYCRRDIGHRAIARQQS
jgi:phosphoribosylamine--glycine ligase